MNSISRFFASVYHFLIDKFTFFVDFIVVVVGALGYPGIIIMMAMESSFIPFPSEVVIPPAGYLTVHGNMNMALVIVCGIVGSAVGSTVNYIIAYKFGRTFLEKYSKYLFLTPERLNYMDEYFNKHGEITTLVGRLIPVVRQYISFPAGLARMHFGKFLFYTCLGASVWVVILAFIGRAVGDNINLVKDHLQTVTYISVPLIILMIAVYVVYNKKKSKK